MLTPIMNAFSQNCFSRAAVNPSPCLPYNTLINSSVISACIVFVTCAVESVDQAHVKNCNSSLLHRKFDVILSASIEHTILKNIVLIKNKFSRSLLKVFLRLNQFSAQLIYLVQIISVHEPKSYGYAL